jgi:hypothetical protein
VEVEPDDVDELLLEPLVSRQPRLIVILVRVGGCIQRIDTLFEA